MALFKVVVEAYVASRELDRATLSRLAFWTDELGEKEIAAIAADDIDAALLRLAERGRLNAGKRQTARSGAPLAGSTVNRYLTQAGSVFKHARRLRLVPRTFVAPTRGIERAPERADPERYLRPEEVERALAVARVLDRQWGKMPALITVAGLARGLDPVCARARSRSRGRHAHRLSHQERRPGDGGTLGRGDRGIAPLAQGRRRRAGVRQ